MNIPFFYKGKELDTAYRADIVVEDEIILELKATENESKLFARQLLTYLRIAHKRLGLLMNFNQEILRSGITRVVNGI